MQMDPGLACDTLFFQGIFATQTQVSWFLGDRTYLATTGEDVTCVGRNNLKPIDVIYHPFVGKEISDIDIVENKHFFKKWLYKLAYWATHHLSTSYGIKVEKNENNPKMEEGTVEHFYPIISRMNFAQEDDIESFNARYQRWKKSPNKTTDLILFGVSRGAATVFDAFAKYHYPEVKMVILEGCFYSTDHVIETSFTKHGKGLLSRALSFFTKYKSDGISPQKSVDNFPENIPVIIITSEADNFVKKSNADLLASDLIKRGKNPVYELKLQHSGHGFYMFDDAKDRETYETFLHAVYQLYGLQHNPILAERGKKYLQEACLFDPNYPNTTLTRKSL